MSKGSNRRPAAVDRETFEERWAQTFDGAQGEEPKGDWHTEAYCFETEPLGIRVRTDPTVPRDEVRIVTKFGTLRMVNVKNEGPVRSTDEGAYRD